MRVLVIGSLSGELGAAGRIAIARGAKLDQADDVETALARLRAAAALDLVMCDVTHDVAALIARMSGERITVPVVACGTDAQADAAVAAIRAGAREFLPLPPDAELIAAILSAVSGETDSRHALIARDPSMLATIRRADQVARAEASVLITGESGTGKEVLARHIHLRSRRAAGPFVALNCAAIPEALLESELFGHEKGAFSGALARRIGKFEAADGGTLLLDEIGELELRLQAKLLRAVQEREIDRVGGGAPVRVDVRILATTNRDLVREVAAGRFREDLYFRLNVVALRVPPLRERPGDIAALSVHFARRYADLTASATGHYRSRRGKSCSGMRGAATSANWRTPFIARCCWRKATRSTRRRSNSAMPPRYIAGTGRHHHAGRAADGRCRARADPAHARPHARQPNARGDHPRHQHPGTSQQAARLCGRR